MKTVDNGDGINQKSLRNKKLYKTSRGKEIEKRKKKKIGGGGQLRKAVNLIRTIAFYFWLT